MRRNSCVSAVILPATSKEIEFVVPPTVNSGASGNLGSEFSGCGGRIANATSWTRLNPAVTAPNDKKNDKSRLTPGSIFGGSINFSQKNHTSVSAQSSNVSHEEQPVINKGWSLIQEIFSSNTSLNEEIKRRNSRSLSVSTLGINHSNLATQPITNQERRASTNSIFLAPNRTPQRRSRSHSKGSIYITTPPNYFRSPASSAPGSRKNSKPTIFVEAAPEIKGYQQLGGLNPSLYLDPEQVSEREEDFPENHLGRLYFTMIYDVTSESLTVTMKRIKNLPKSRKEWGSTNKTYVKICLLPDERSQRKCTPSKDNFADLNPTFDESFVFQVSPSDWDTRTLQLIVYNVDVNRKHKPIGQTLVDLAELDFTRGKLNLTADLEKFVRSSIDSESAELLLSICYNPSLNRLTVNVVEAKNLKAESGNAPDTYIRLQLMQHAKEIKRKKTSLVKKEFNPQYKESFNFKVDENDIEMSGLKITCFHAQTLLGKDRPLGELILGGPMFAKGSGMEHWSDVTKYLKMFHQKWHLLTEVVK